MLCVQHCSVLTRSLHAAERHSSRRKLQGGKPQKSGNRAQTLVSYLEGATSWEEMTHLQLQKQGTTCLRCPCQFCMSRLLHIGWSEQMSVHPDAQHCFFAQILAVLYIAHYVLLFMMADHCRSPGSTCLLLICMTYTAVWDRRHSCNKYGSCGACPILVWSFWTLVLALCSMCFPLSQPHGPTLLILPCSHTDMIAWANISALT